MKKYNLDSMLLIMIISLIIPVSSFSQRHPRELSKPSEVSFKSIKPTEFTLSNGIKVFYLEDKELPLINLGGIIKVGDLYEPEEKTGLSQLTGTVMRTGGTKTMPGNKIDEELEMISANINITIGDEYANFSSECLTKDFKKVLQIASDILINPQFPQDKIELAKNQMKESLRRRWDQPNSASSQIFSEMVYGKGNPYSRRYTTKTLNNITRDDMVDFHQRYFAPNNTYLLISGDISQKDAKMFLENAFKNWKKKTITFPKIDPLVEKSDGTVYYAYQNTPQANLYLGHLGIQRNNPDQYKVDLMNTMLGGGFTARLMKELRSNRGLTYGIRGGVNSGRDKGLFQISSQLKAERIVEALNLIKDIIKDMQNNPVSDEEFDRSKNATINSFAFKFDQKDRYLSQYVNLKLNGYPDNYLDKYIENIKKVTKADIMDVGKKYLNPEKMIVVIVGDEKRFDKPLSSFGKVVPVEIKKISEEERVE